MKFLHVASTLLLCLPVFGQDLLQDTDAEDQPKVKDAIVVTATRSEREVSDVPVSTTVVSEEEIESAPAVAPDDMLRAIPGVQMHIGSSTAAFSSLQTVSMHGLGGMRALVLVDGVPMHDPSMGAVQWHKVPLDSVRQVEIVRGASASLFGNFALGGTIHLITRRAEENAVRLDLSYGTSQTTRTLVGIDHVFSPTLSGRISHSRYNSDGYIRVPNPGPIDIRGWNDTTVTDGRIDFEASEHTRGFFKANTAEIGISAGSAISWEDRDITEFATGFHHILNGRHLLSGTVFHQYNADLFKTGAVIGAREAEYPLGDSLYDARGTGGSFDWSVQRSGAIPFVSAGFDFQSLAAAEDREAFSPAGAVISRNNTKGRQRFAGAFLQASWQPADRFEVLSSLRLDRYENSDAFDTEQLSGVRTDYRESNTTQLNPRVSFRYGAIPRLAIRGAVYRAFKAPTLRELYRTIQSGTTTVLANPELEAETLVGGEIGLEWALSRAHVELNVYRSDLENMVARARAPGRPPNVIQYQNLSAARSQGIELMVQSRISRQWSFDAGYTYADSKIVDHPTPSLIGKLLPDVAPHTGTLGVRFNGDDGTSVNLRGRALSRSYGETSNAVAAPAHRVVDITISRPMLPWLTAYVVGENIFDDKYFYVLTPTSFRTAPPRMVSAGVRIRTSPW